MDINSADTPSATRLSATVQRRPRNPDNSLVLESLELAGHLKIVAHLLARHKASPVFSEAKRFRLLVIGGQERPTAAHRRALKALSRRVALLDLPEVLDA